MNRRPRPTAGLKAGERRIFWHLYGACGDTNSSEVDLDEHLRETARTIAWHLTHPSKRERVR